MRRAFHICIPALLLLAPVTARGWESSAKWGGHVVGYKVNPANQDVTEAQALAAIRESADAWTEQTQAAFRFRYDGAGTATVQSMNGTNLVLFRDAEGSSPTVRASTYTWKLLGFIIETDIVFWDKSMSFVTASMPCNKDIVIENTAIHEFGHALGLDHTDVATATMWSKSSVCSTDRLILDPDDIAGIESLYPCSNASQCDDDDVCTADTCNNSKCIRSPIAGCCTKKADCDDGDVCTKDSCQSNVCKHAPIDGCCTEDVHCDDGDVCTSDACSDNLCSNTPIAGCCSQGCDAGPYPLDAQLVDALASSDVQAGYDLEPGPLDGGSGSDAASAPHVESSGCTLSPGSAAAASSGAWVLALLLLWRRRRARPG